MELKIKKKMILNELQINISKLSKKTEYKFKEFYEGNKMMILY